MPQLRNATRYCEGCGIDYPPADFYGGSSYCRWCKKPYRKTTQSQAVSRKENLLGLYNMTTKDYDKRLKAQGGVCAICQAAPDVFGRHLAVDHDHACCPGKESCGECVRGLLCGKCNMGIGLFEDSPTLLATAIQYLSGDSV